MAPGPKNHNSHSVFLSRGVSEIFFPPDILPPPEIHPRTITRIFRYVSTVFDHLRRIPDCHAPVRQIADPDRPGPEHRLFPDRNPLYYMASRPDLASFADRYTARQVHTGVQRDI